MAKKIVGYIKLQIPAGKANPSPPVGPALGLFFCSIRNFNYISISCFLYYYPY